MGIVQGVRVNLLDPTRVEEDQDRTSRGYLDDGPGARPQRYPLAGIGGSSPLMWWPL